MMDSCLPLQIFREQVEAVSMLPGLPPVPATRMQAVVEHLQDIWHLPHPANPTKKRRGACLDQVMSAVQVSSAADTDGVLPPVAQLSIHLPAFTVCASASSPPVAGATAEAQQSSAPAPDETDNFLRYIAKQKNTGTGVLREEAHMQPAAMELLQGMQQVLGSSTGLVLKDTHRTGHLHNPVKKIDCSGLAANNSLWTQLVVPFEFKLHTTEADGALGQLTETAGFVVRQQPGRRFLCGVSITLDTVEAFHFGYGPRGSFSHILSTGVQPLELQPDSAGLCLLASIVAAPLPQLGFVTVSLPSGQLADYHFRCTNSLAVRSESGTQGARQNSRVYLAQLDDKRSAVLKLAKSSKEVRLGTYQLLLGKTVTLVCMSVCKDSRHLASGGWPGPPLIQGCVLALWTGI